MDNDLINIKNINPICVYDNKENNTKKVRKISKTESNNDKSHYDKSLNDKSLNKFKIIYRILKIFNILKLF